MLLDFFVPTGGRKSRKLISTGDRAEATVVGIRVTETSDSPARWAYALDVHASSGTFRVGCRQALNTEARRAATIGRRVLVRHDGKQAVIDEAAMFGVSAGASAATGNTGWKAIKPPGAGITDARSAARTASPTATPTIVRVVTVEPTDWEERWTITVLAGASDLPVVLRTWVPHYAASRVIPGADLHAHVAADGRLVVDWNAVAMAMPAPDGPPNTNPAIVESPIVDTVQPVPPTETERTPLAIGVPYVFADKADAKEFAAWMKVRAMKSHGVPASTIEKTMKKSGIPPELWQSVDAKWMQQCQCSPALAEQLRLAGG